MNETEKNKNFQNIMEVVKYLRSAGWKATKSTVYRHREQGLIGPLPDGTYSRDDVQRYARDRLGRVSGAGPAVRSKAAVDQDTKSAAEARKVSAQAEHWEIKTKILRGEYVERSAFERALARRAAVFKSDIENFIRNNCGEMIAMVAGDATRMPDLIEFWLEQSENWLARYAEDREVELPAAAGLNH